MKPSRIIVILSSLTLLVSLSACTTDGGAPSDGPKGQGNQSTGGNLSNQYVEVSAEAGVAPTISSPSGTPPTTLVTEDVIVGSGKVAGADSTPFVRRNGDTMTGTLSINGGDLEVNGSQNNAIRSSGDVCAYVQF